jgi:hypothetical protein
MTSGNEVNVFSILSVITSEAIFILSIEDLPINLQIIVNPAKAGIRSFQDNMDFRLSGNDAISDFLRFRQLLD